MARQTLFLGILVLALLGLADSVYLADSALTNSSLSCGIAGLDGCNTVAQSAYSKFLGIPLAVYGILFYVLIIASMFYAKSVRTMRSFQILFFFASVGALLSFYFMFLQVFVIKAICIYCAGSFLASVIIWALSCRLFRLMRAVPLSLPDSTPLSV
jgi:uncharacterized membrane protein